MKFCTWILALTPLVAQTLPYGVRDAAYSSSLNRLIVAAETDGMLHIFDPSTQMDTAVPLTVPALTLSVSPDGLYAAVGHLTRISYVSLTTGTVVKTIPVPAQPRKLALSATHIYADLGPGNFRSISLATGAVSPPIAAADSPTRFQVHPNGRQLLLVRFTLTTFDISSGDMVLEPSNSALNICDPFWIAADGVRLYTACAKVRQLSSDPKFHLSYLRTIGQWSLPAIADSIPAQLTAAIPAVTKVFGVPVQTEVHLYNRSSLDVIGRFSLPPQSAGRYLFFNSTGTALYALSQAQEGDFTVHTFNLSAPSCRATATTSTASASAAGGVQTEIFTSSPDCPFTAVSSQPWLEIVQPARGSGAQAIRYHVQPNSSPTPRTATISAGDFAFTVTQAGFSAPSPVISFNVIDAAYSTPLDRLILVSDTPNALHLSGQVIPLPQTPNSVVVRPDGLSAAVGHDGAVSIVNLQTRQLESTRPVPALVSAIAYPANGYVYVSDSPQAQNAEVSLHLATNVWQVLNYTLSPMRLSPTGDALYSGLPKRYDVRFPHPRFLFQLGRRRLHCSVEHSQLDRHRHGSLDHPPHHQRHQCHLSRRRQPRCRPRRRRADQRIHRHHRPRRRPLRQPASHGHRNRGQLQWPHVHFLRSRRHRRSRHTQYPD